MPPGRNESFFHGTVHDIGVGGRILPARESGKRNYRGSLGYGRQRSDRWAHVTTSEKEAWEFAERKRSQAWDQTKRQRDVSMSPDQRVRVYETAPHPMMHMGVYHPDHPRHRPEVGGVHEWLAPNYKVTAVHDIKPGHQGTLPNINWNQFSGVKSWSDANHPSWEEVEHGHAYGQSKAWQDKWDAEYGPKPGRTEVTGQLALFLHPDERR